MKRIVVVDPAKLARITTLYSGAHHPNGKYCAMEAAAYVAGERWNDHPTCVSPVIAAFMRRWNDDIRDDATRTRLLLPLIAPCVGTAGGDEQRLAWMCVDWLARTHAPAWYRLTPALVAHGDALAGLPEITVSSWPSAESTVAAARAAAAGGAAWAAARAAAWEAAWEAARAAAWDAAWAAARDATWAAARAAAWEAASDAAWAAARAAAWEAASDAAWAAGAALKPTTSALQESAQAFVLRMCAVAKETQ